MRNYIESVPSSYQGTIMKMGGICCETWKYQWIVRVLKISEKKREIKCWQEIRNLSAVCELENIWKWLKLLTRRALGLELNEGRRSEKLSNVIQILSSSIPDPLFLTVLLWSLLLSKFYPWFWSYRSKFHLKAFLIYFQFQPCSFHPRSFIEISL